MHFVTCKNTECVYIGTQQGSSLPLTPEGEPERHKTKRPPLALGSDDVEIGPVGEGKDELDNQGPRSVELVTMPRSPVREEGKALMSRL